MRTQTKAGGIGAAGFPDTRPLGSMRRACGRCGVGPNIACRRWVAALVGGVDIGGGYFKNLKRPHKER